MLRRLYDRIEGREVVVARGLITLVVVVGASWGADFTDIGQRAENTLDAVAVFAALVGLGWQRHGVTPVKDPRV